MTDELSEFPSLADSQDAPEGDGCKRTAGGAVAAWKAVELERFRSHVSGPNVQIDIRESKLPDTAKFKTSGTKNSFGLFYR